MSIYQSAIGDLVPDGEWVWPVPIWQGREPEVSDRFQFAKNDQHRQHLGLDIMFRRLPNEPIKLPHTTKHFAMPDGVPVLAARSGKIISIEEGNRGGAVKIYHKVGGRELVSFYQHLSQLNSALQPGDTIGAGTVLGIVGGDIAQGQYPLWHLHYEIRDLHRGKTRPKQVIDPAPYLAASRKLIGDQIGVFELGPKPRSRPVSRRQSGSVVLPILLVIAGFAIARFA